MAISSADGSARSVRAIAAVEQCPKGICLELLVLPAAERRGNQEFAAQLPRSPRSEAEGGTSYSIVSGYLHESNAHLSVVFTTRG